MVVVVDPVLGANDNEVVYDEQYYVLSEVDYSYKTAVDNIKSDKLFVLKIGRNRLF